MLLHTSGATAIKSSGNLSSSSSLYLLLLVDCGLSFVTFMRMAYFLNNIRFCQSRPKHVGINIRLTLRFERCLLIPFRAQKRRVSRKRTSFKKTSIFEKTSFFLKDVQFSRLLSISRNMLRMCAIQMKWKQTNFIQRTNLFQRSCFQKSRLCSYDALHFWKRRFIAIFPYLFNLPNCIFFKYLNQW